jgi:hypothetical protein
MVKSDSDDWLKSVEKSSDFDDGRGDDWESAFQAEEFMFSPGERERGGLFLDKTGPSTAYEFTPPDDGDLTDLPDLDQTAGKPAPAHPGQPTAHPPVSLAVRWRRLREGFSGLPLVHRLALGSTTLLVALLILILLWPPGRQSGPGAGAPAVMPPAFQTAAPEQPLPAENVRRKWQLAPFFLPVAAAEPLGKTTFLEVDLSLILVLTPEGELPESKKMFVRDLIYRYYQEQPLATLRHFSLARGEMNRTLLAWLREHWPEAPIETVVFARYQLT